VKEDGVLHLSELSEIQTKPGWKAMPYILGLSLSLSLHTHMYWSTFRYAGNETMERLATYGLTANFMVYLMREFQMDQVVAANILNIWSAASNFATIIGAFVADNYLGKFRTIALGSFASLAVLFFLHPHSTIYFIGWSWTNVTMIQLTLRLVIDKKIKIKIFKNW